MLIRFTQDINTKQTVYASVNASGKCKALTTSILEAIRQAQQSIS